MLRAHLLHKTALCCPSCRISDYVTYRRLPMGDGRVMNRCVCRKCGGSFEFEEDRQGHPIRK